MRLKRLFAMCSALLVAFSCFSRAYATDSTVGFGSPDANGAVMYLYFDKQGIDPLYQSISAYNVPYYLRSATCELGTFSGASATEIPCALISSTFPPTPADADNVERPTVYYIYGLWSESSGVSFGYGTNRARNGLAYNSKRAARDIRQTLVTWGPVGSHGFMMSCRTTLPPDTIQFEFPRSNTESPTIAVSGSGTVYAGFYGAWVVYQPESVLSQLDEIIRLLTANNEKLDTQIGLLESIVNHLNSIDATVTDIYSLLRETLTDESTELTNAARQAAETIMQEQDSEQFWTDKNSDTFNAIDLNGFSFDSTVLAGLSLVGKVFTSIWNAVGDTVIIYVFPLTLGVALVVIGRISRSGGNGKNKSGGDDG